MKQKKMVNITEKGRKAKRFLLFFSSATNVGKGVRTIEGGVVAADVLDFLKGREGRASKQSLESLIERKYIVSKSDARNVLDWLLRKRHVEFEGQSIPGEAQKDRISSSRSSRPSPFHRKSPRITPKRPKLRR